MEGKIAARGHQGLFSTLHRCSQSRHPDFVGIAQSDRLHHLEWACHNQMEANGLSVRQFMEKNAFA
ncbi:MAG: hypothetical protein R2875_18635 [Desulfobacterales bacterium]